MKINTVVVGAIETNCLIVSDENTGRGFVVDPGAEPNAIADTLASLGISVEAVLLTHGHFDHILGIERLLKAVGDIPVICSEAERALLADPELNCTARIRIPKSIVPDRTVLDGEILELAGMSFKCILTPGHTAGSMCYYSEENSLLIVGDTLFLQSVGRTDLPTGDYSALMDSLKNKVLTLPEDTFVIPGHGPCTDIGHEKMFY